MLSSQFTLIKFLAVAGLVRAGVTPTKPGPGESFNAGSDCQISWNLDTTGTWTSFSIDLMSGSNLAMQPVVNVFKGKDGTKAPGTHTFPCPEVTPNSAIYFYQFSQAGAETTWTTRFTIASASGQTTPPANATQPSGQPIPWGIGRLTSGATDTSSTTTTSSATPSSSTNSSALNTSPLVPATNSTATLPTSNTTTSNLTPITSTTSTANKSTSVSTPNTSSSSTSSSPVKNTSSSSSTSSTPANPPTSSSSQLQTPFIFIISSALICKFLI